MVACPVGGDSQRRLPVCVVLVRGCCGRCRMPGSPTAAAAIGKLELSKTGTHLNVVTLADLEGAEGSGDSAEPVSIGAALEQVKLAVDAVDDATYVQRPRPAMVDGHVAAPKLTDDPWNVLPGPWNGGKGKQGFGGRHRREQCDNDGAASPMQSLPLKKLASRASALELEREALVATIANRASWHGMDEHGNVARWVQSAAPRGSEAKSPYQRTLSRKDQISEDWRQHLASAKALAMKKRRDNLKEIKSYQRQVDKRPVGSHATQQLATLMQQQNEAKQRARAAEKAAAESDDAGRETFSVETDRSEIPVAAPSALSVSVSPERSSSSLPATVSLKQEQRETEGRRPRRERNTKKRPPRALNRSLGSSAYNALEPSQEIAGLSREKVQRKVRMEEERMARVQTEETMLRQRRHRKEKAAMRRRQHKKEQRKQDWGSTLSLPDIRANPRADPALCYGARSVPPIR